MHFLKKYRDSTILKLFKTRKMPSEIFSIIIKCFAVTANADEGKDCYGTHSFFMDVAETFKFDSVLKEASDSDV